MPNRKSYSSLTDRLSGPALLHYTLPFVMLYLLAGTVAQKYIGLFEATHIFFAAPVIWLSFVPLPGFPVLLGVMFVNLTCKLLFKSPWTLRGAGTIVTHMAVLLLLFGGLLTALFSREGFVDLLPGETKAYVTDYHAREFLVRSANGQTVVAWNPYTLRPGQALNLPQIPLTVEVMETCRHCDIRQRTIAAQDERTYNGMAEFMALHPAPLKKDDERNMGGITFALRDDAGHVQGVYTALEDVPNWPQIENGEESYRFIYRKAQRSLPFSVELLAFKRETHPGTELAKAYESRVRIHDAQGSWESVISMNEPLRYKGYTLFQSSFTRTQDGEASVLAVVWNAGRAFPYIAGLVLCLGLILHLFVRRRA